MDHPGTCHHDPGALDVRPLAPRVRHPRIFETFNALARGSSFVLVNDHDPKPLYYQFQAERPGQFGWRYLEEGPDVWRVEISKRPAPYTADQKVEHISRAPEALAVLERMGINHCCGAQLTLTEAAAAAGVAIDDLLRGLNETVGAPV